MEQFDMGMDENLIFIIYFETSCGLQDTFELCTPITSVKLYMLKLISMTLIHCNFCHESDWIKDLFAYMVQSFRFIIRASSFDFATYITIYRFYQLHSSL